MATKVKKPEVVDSFQKLAKDEGHGLGMYGDTHYKLANGSAPCYIYQQKIWAHLKMSDDGKRRYIALCRKHALKNALVQFTVTAREEGHLDWVNVFCEYMDQGGVVFEAQSKQDGRYKCWLLTIPAIGK